MAVVNIKRSIAKAGDLDLFCLDTGTEAPVILCLHGRWGRAETWCDFLGHYGDRYRVIAPDLRGHGLSGKPASGYGAEEMAGDLVALLDGLGIENAIVVGHSMGGHVAGYLAARHPAYVRALAILDKSANGPVAPRPAATGESAIEDPVTALWPLPFRSREEAEDHIRRSAGSELGLRYFMNSLVETVEGYTMMFSEAAIRENIARYASWFDLLPSIRCPVMLVRARGGEALPDGDFAKMRALLPDCLAFEMSQGDHNVHLADRGEFYRFFDAFLGEKVATRPN
jgi:2-succinyl-6-hydroxy-2,4-cyclohexadiene-1-carboxylate synthase